MFLRFQIYNPPKNKFKLQDFQPKLNNTYMWQRFPWQDRLLASRPIYLQGKDRLRLYTRIRRSLHGRKTPAQLGLDSLKLFWMRIFPQPQNVTLTVFMGASCQCLFLYFRHFQKMFIYFLQIHQVHLRKFVCNLKWNLNLNISSDWVMKVNVQIKKKKHSKSKFQDVRVDFQNVAVDFHGAVEMVL